MKKFIIRPSIGTYLIFGNFIGLILGIFVIGNALIYIFPEGNPILILLCSLLVIPIIDLIIYQYNICIDNLSISTNKTLFKFYKKQNILINEIEEMRIEFGSTKNKNGFITLLLKGCDNNIQINIKPFSKEDIIKLIKYILKNKEDIKVNKFIEEMLFIK